MSTRRQAEEILRALSALPSEKVMFEPGHIPGLAFFDMERELSEILGRKADLNTPGFLSPYFREEALAKAEPQYERS